MEAVWRTNEWNKKHMVRPARPGDAERMIRLGLDLEYGTMCGLKIEPSRAEAAIVDKSEITCERCQRCVNFKVAS